MDAENACNGGKANGSYLDNGRANEFQSACSIRYVHDLISLVIKFVVPYKMWAPDAKTWVVVIELFNEWTLISWPHYTSKSWYRWSKR